MNQPAVTVGMPIYNAAPYLEMAIQSIVNQTFTDWELILLDDGSTDASLAIARRWSGGRIRVVSDGQNRGQTARLNELTQLSRSQYLARMDADDIMAPTRLQQQVAYLKAHPDVDLVGSFIYIIDTKNRVYGQRGTTQLPTTLADAITGFPLAHPAVTGKRAWFRQHPYSLAIRRTQDFDLWLRTVDHSRFAVIDQPLLFYREIDVPYLKKYLQTTREIWRILDQHAATVGYRAVQLQKARLLAKSVIYRLFSALGQENVLLKRRSEPLSIADRQRARALLDHSIRPTQTLPIGA
jgi:glycosyltransferase involved in cell wall biosynthesis